MNDLILKIEEWAEARNIINGSKPIDQAMKLFSEAGELADNVGKGRDVKDDVGDCLVVMIVMTKQIGHSISDLGTYPKWHDGNTKYSVLSLMESLTEFVKHTDFEHFHVGVTKRILNILNSIARNNKATLEQCLEVAYNDIKDRKGRMTNGVFIKEGDI